MTMRIIFGVSGPFLSPDVGGITVFGFLVVRGCKDGVGDGCATELDSSTMLAQQSIYNDNPPLKK